MKKYLFILLFFSSCTSNYYQGDLTNSVKLDTIRGKDFISISATSEAIITYIDSTTKSQTKIELLQIPIVKFFDTIYYDSLRIKDSTVTKIETTYDTIIYVNYVDSTRLVDSIVLYNVYDTIHIDSAVIRDSVIFDTIKIEKPYNFYYGRKDCKYKIVLADFDISFNLVDTNHQSISFISDLRNEGHTILSKGDLNGFTGIGYSIRVTDSLGNEMKYTKGVIDEDFEFLTSRNERITFDIYPYSVEDFENSYFTFTLYENNFDNEFYNLYFKTGLVLEENF